MTRILETQNMGLTPKGRSHPGSAALNHGEKPGTSLADPFDLSRGGNPDVGQFKL
jgi:hypothetical protein